MQLPLLLLIICVGAIVSLQPGVNARVGGALGHPLLGAFVSFLGGVLSTAIALAFVRPALPTLQQAMSAPWWAYSGGVLGAALVVATLIAAPKLGVVLMFTALISGQMVGSLIIDHYGLVGLPVREISPGRVLGVALVILGLVLVQRSTPKQVAETGDSTPTAAEVSRAG